MNTSTIAIPITFGDLAPQNSYINVYCSGFYRDASGIIRGSFIPNIKTMLVRVYKVKAPTISLPTLLDCCNARIQFSASAYDDADVFNWTISGGTIFSGQGTPNLIITPTGNGSVTASCTVQRTSGLPNYIATSTQTVGRTTRTASFTALYPDFPNNSQPYEFICRNSVVGTTGYGRQMSMLTQCGFASVNWVAPNCTITGQGTLTPTITPNSSVATGTTITVYANVNFDGGCVAQTPIKTFTVLDSTISPLPVGNFVATPSNGDICTAQLFEMSFVNTNGFNNGITTLSPDFIWGPGDTAHYVAGRKTKITVCNKNLCTGQTTCSIFYVLPPAPCPAPALKISTLTTPIAIVIAPNPTDGKFSLTMNQLCSGQFNIFDRNGFEVQNGKFIETDNVAILLFDKIKNGTYIVKVNINNEIFTEQIVLNK